MYFAPYHVVIEENIELSNVLHYDDVIHLMGRDKLCLSNTYREYAKKGINIQPFCENFCTFKDNKCPYYKNIRTLLEEPKCFAAVHHHIPTLLHQLIYEDVYGEKFYKYYDVMIIDEFPTSTIYNSLSLTRKDIDYSRDVLQMTQVSGIEKDYIMNFLNQLSLATKSIGIDHEEIKKLLEQRGIKFDKFKKDYELGILELINMGRIKSPPNELIHFIIEIYNLNPSLEKLKWMLYKAPTTQWMKGRIYITISNIHYFVSLPIKIIALDGTADIETWRSVIGSPISSIKYDLEYTNTYQLIGARNPVSTVVQTGDLTDSGKKLTDIVATICKYRDYKVLICCTKRVSKLIKKRLDSFGVRNYVFANYYNLRSRNSYYENSDVCVLFHEPNIPPFQSSIITNVLELDEDIVRRIYRDDEMKQAIGRIRINIPVTPSGRLRNKREVFILSSTGYEKLVPEASYMTYNEITSYVKSGKRRMFLDNLKEIIRENSPITKDKLSRILNLSHSKLNHVLGILNRQGVVKIDWGNVEWIQDPSEDQRQEFIIKVGGKKW